jgi:glycogen operon protein
MLLAGDELGRTQLGNNNAYCQDNETSFLDWEAAGKHADLIDFTSALIALRHDHAVFRRRRFFSGTAPGSTGLGDITWLTPAGAEMTVHDWSSAGRALAVLLNGDAITEPGPRGEAIVDDSFLLLFNVSDQPVTFTLPGAGAASAWAVVVDTTSAELPAGEPRQAASVLTVAGRAVVVLRADAAR